MAMPVHEVWFLLALALIIGGFGGSLIGNWWSERRCCECCTCEDCGEPEEVIYERAWQDYLDVPRPEPEQDLRQPVRAGPGYSDRRTILLEPGPTIYPELRALAEEALDGPESHAERPDTGTWMRTIRLKWDLQYPIPGTPQWEARHPVGVS